MGQNQPVQNNPGGAGKFVHTGHACTYSPTENPASLPLSELIFFSSIAATVVSLAAVSISGQHHVLKRDIRRFGTKSTYVSIMMGQIAAWQVHWVGLMGLVFAVSSVFSNVISVTSWPIVTVVGVIFFNFDKDEFDAFKGAALACAFLSDAFLFL